MVSIGKDKFNLAPEVEGRVNWIDPLAACSKRTFNGMRLSTMKTAFNK